MSMINTAYGQLPPAFFFTRMGETVSAYAAAHPDQHLLRLGVGDVTGPLAPAVIAGAPGRPPSTGICPRWAWTSTGKRWPPTMGSTA